MMQNFRWLPDNGGQIYETKKGNRYRFGRFDYDNRALLFPDYCEFDRTVKWYAPTEKQIFATNDEEIINIYYKIDKENRTNKERRNEEKSV